MKWKVRYSKEAEKFINKQDIRDKVRNAIRKFLQRSLYDTNRRFEP